VWCRFLLAPGSLMSLSDEAGDQRSKKHKNKSIEQDEVEHNRIEPCHMTVAVSTICNLLRILTRGNREPIELLKKGLQKWGPIFVQAYGMTSNISPMREWMHVFQV
jgi:hypothetical protein